MKGLTRRDFLKSTAIIGAAAGVASVSGLVGCSDDQGDLPLASSIRWDRECDVLVVGGGATGVTCAAVVSEAGKSV
ncbi:MAG: twin-arginine translocation signal domain-containing protein, partial [Coriobacteriales bacterium]|nr:twin-arginine translocation signal domain-containing protein [Coriobacteriales bacterium]